MIDLLEGFCMLNYNLWLCCFGSCLKNPMFLAKKSPRSYVGLYQNFLYKIFSLLLTPPLEHSSHTSPDTTAVESGPRSKLFCAPQEAVQICSGHWAFPKCTADATIGRSPCDTSIPSDMLRSFIQVHFILFCDHSWGDLPFSQEVCSHP